MVACSRKKFLEAVEEYQNAEETIGEFFDCESLAWQVMNFYMDEKWYDNGDVMFDLQDGDFQGEFEIYGTSRFEKDGFVAFVGNNNGNQATYIFKKENELTCEEVEELE